MLPFKHLIVIRQACEAIQAFNQNKSLQEKTELGEAEVARSIIPEVVDQSGSAGSTPGQQQLYLIECTAPKDKWDKLSPDERMVYVTPGFETAWVANSK